MSDLAERLRRLREDNAVDQGTANGNITVGETQNEVESSVSGQNQSNQGQSRLPIQRMDESRIYMGTPPTRESSASTNTNDEYLSVPVWHDTKSNGSDYVNGSNTRQVSFRRAMSRSPGSASSNASYENAFRIVQQAVEAEQDGDPMFAVELYADAGEMLVKVGKSEPDPLLQKGMKDKAFELLRRAEQLEQWYNSIQASAAPQAKPQQKIQRIEVPTIQNSWGGRTPPYSKSEEYTNMRYTAVSTKDPIQFTNDKYQLRCFEYGHRIKTFITITMYNEEGSELKGTLTGIAKNLKFMAKEFGPNYWEEVAVAIVSDGRTKASASCLEYLTSLGAFDEEQMTVTSLGVDVQMHLFESCVQLVQDENFEAFYPPIQLIYALKEHNGGKLNSHLWFFNAFAEQLIPTYTVLIDVGTIPGDKSIYRLIRSMDRNPQIGGVAGEIAVYKPNYFNPVIAAQHFEYKISNIMDKSLESVFGFISVLPGAFSAYRYEAIRADSGAGPLPEYFKSLTTSTKDLGPFKGNMYLAEDRILCFELLARDGRRWTMHYVKDAIACTDVPETLVDLIKQRRRWLNGSFFAGVFAIWNFGRVWRRSAHSFPRKLVFTFQFLYLAIQNLLNWFLISNLFLTFFYVLLLAIDSDVAFQAIMSLYLSIVGGVIVFALGNRPDKATGGYYAFACLFFGLVMVAVTAISVAGLIVGSDLKDDRDLPISNCEMSDGQLEFGVITAIGLIFLSAFVHGEFSILLSTIQYFFMLPTFVNILGIFAYSNLHDLSWGTKGLESGGGHGAPKATAGGGVKDVVAQKKREEEARRKAAAEKEEVENSFRAFRSVLLLVWLVTNGVWLYVAISILPSSCYLQYLSFVVAAFNLTRFIGSVIFIIFRILRRFGCAAKGSSGSNGSNYQQQLPAEWRAHYSNQAHDARQDIRETERRVDISVDSPHAGVPSSHYREMNSVQTTSL